MVYSQNVAHYFHNDVDSLDLCPDENRSSYAFCLEDLASFIVDEHFLNRYWHLYLPAAHFADWRIKACLVKVY